MRETGMLWAGVAGFVLGLTGAGLACGQEAKETAEEYKRFEGTWKIVSMKAEGQDVPADAFGEAVLILKGNAFTFKDMNTEYKGTFKLDVKSAPKQIDMTFTDGPEKGKTIPGIYKLEGDTYTLAVAPAKEGERPTEFLAEQGSGWILEVLKREKPKS